MSQAIGILTQSSDVLNSIDANQNKINDIQTIMY